MGAQGTTTLKETLLNLLCALLPAFTTQGFRFSAPNDIEEIRPCTVLTAPRCVESSALDSAMKKTLTLLPILSQVKCPNCLRVIIKISAEQLLHVLYV